MSANAKPASLTPGPWEYFVSSDSWMVTRSTAGQERVAKVYGPAADTEANARLIAAAPEMAEALQALANTANNADADFLEYRSALRYAVIQARAVLAKAGVL